MVPSDGAPILDAQAIRHAYGRKVVLDDVCLTVATGEAVAIVGENGAGKSTLLRICAGLIRPAAGTVSLRGRPGYCPQIPGVFDLLNADEHLRLFAPALGLSERDGLAQGRAVLDQLGFPVGDRSPVRVLSGGARQKLNLALALLGDARVLLLDEPYQGFDRDAYVSFWEHVATWREDGLGIVVVTHLLADLSYVDRVLELTIPGRPRRSAEAELIAPP